MLNQIQGFRLSPQQKRLWSFHENSAAYNTICTIECSGELQYDALHAALQQLVNQHEILRTTYQRKPGIAIPLQVIADTQEVRLQSIDIADQQAAEQETTIAHSIAQEQQKSFAESATLTLFLFKVAPQKHILLISLPALSADAMTITNTTVTLLW